jgi:hypothetical protein
MSMLTILCSAYTVPIQVGTSGQNMSLQVDTGSSDLVSHSFQVPQHLVPNGPTGVLVDRIDIMYERGMFRHKRTLIRFHLVGKGDG